MQNMTLLPPEIPLRTFEVRGSSGHTEKVEGHRILPTPTGALVVTTLVAGNEFSTHCWAPGTWTGYTTVAPTRAEVEALVAQQDTYDEQVKAVQFALDAEQRTIARTGKQPTKH